jgi:hypothetical protein
MVIEIKNELWKKEKKGVPKEFYGENKR